MEFGDGRIIIQPGAFEAKEVPLVMYDDEGNRKEIGVAFVNKDGEISLNVTDELIIDMLNTTNGNFSIGELRMDGAEFRPLPAKKKEQ